MTWRAPRRTPQAEAVHAAAEADRAARPGAYALDPDAIVAKALRGADPAELGAPARWREGLDRYLASAREDGRLNAVGTRMVRDSAAAGIRARLAMNRRPHPDRPLDRPPIVIIGGWRTGTTFLYRLLATDPRLRAPLPSELAVPWKFAGASPERRAERPTSQSRYRLIGGRAARHWHALCRTTRSSRPTNFWRLQ